MRLGILHARASKTHRIERIGKFARICACWRRTCADLQEPEPRVGSSKPTSRPASLPLGYMPQLDGLRAVAVVGIWFEHWGISQEPGFLHVEWGKLAVWLFFVLSGFLITGILLKSKLEIEDGAQGVG